MLSFLANGDIAEFNEARRSDLAARLAALLPALITPEAVSVSVRSASVVISMHVVVPSGSSTEAVSAALAAALPTAAAVSHAFNVVALSIPAYVTPPNPPPLPNPPPPLALGEGEENNQTLIAVWTGALMAFLVGTALCYLSCTSDKPAGTAASGPTAYKQRIS